MTTSAISDRHAWYVVNGLLDERRSLRGDPSERKPGTLGYGFEPVPARARAARILGTLSAAEYDLLGFLYGRSNFKTLAAREPTPRLTLDQIADGIHWPYTPSALHKMLGRMRRDGWFAYEVKRGGGRYRYEFVLRPDPPPEPEPMPEPSKRASTSTFHVRYVTGRSGASNS